MAAGKQTIPTREPLFHLMLQNRFQAAAGPYRMHVRRTGPAVLTVLTIPGNESTVRQVSKEHLDLRFAQTTDTNVHGSRIRISIDGSVRVMNVSPAGRMIDALRNPMCGRHTLKC